MLTEWWMRCAYAPMRLCEKDPHSSPLPEGEGIEEMSGVFS